MAYVAVPDKMFHVNGKEVDGAIVAKLIADAPMLACRVAELVEELERLARNCLANGYADDSIPVRAALRVVSETRQALAGRPEQESRAPHGEAAR